MSSWTRLGRFDGITVTLHQEETVDGTKRQIQFQKSHTENVYPKGSEANEILKKAAQAYEAKIKALTFAAHPLELMLSGDKRSKLDRARQDSWITPTFQATPVSYEDWQRLPVEKLTESYTNNIGKQMVWALENSYQALLAKIYSSLDSSHPMVQTACKMAHVLHHPWLKSYLGDDGEETQPLTDVRKQVDSFNHNVDGWQQMRGPWVYVNQDGKLGMGDTSNSQRIDWDVDLNGVLTYRVCRPKGVAFTVILSDFGSSRSYVKLIIGDVPFGERHTEWFDHLAEYWREVETDPETSNNFDAVRAELFNSDNYRPENNI
jgi:hypothetical protein